LTGSKRQRIEEALLGGDQTYMNRTGVVKDYMISIIMAYYTFLRDCPTHRRLELTVRKEN
jgi:hypothetical protein